MPLAIIAVALALGTFMQVLDSTIANVSIPTISGNLGVAPDQGTWVITLFAMSNGVSVPLTGWLMGRYGVVRVFCASVALFTAASFLCGIAWDLPSLLAFRILQGAVSGPMIPGSQALLISIFAPSRRGLALGIWSMTTLVAPICGPILGGWISDNISWRWIFYINVPIGILCTVVCFRGLIARETPTFKRSIDTVGFLFLLVWVGAVQVLLDRGEDADWFHSPLIIGLAIASVIGFASWLIWELTEANPIVDLSLFKSRNFAVGTVVFCVAYAVFFGGNVLQPLWLQTRLDYIATWAGLVAAPSGVVAVLLTPVFSRFSATVDARITATLALIAFSASFFMRSGWTPDSSFGVLIVPMLVQGVAMSTFFISMITIQLKDVPPAQTPSASGLSNFVRITGGGFAASLTTALWDRRATLHQSHLADIQPNQTPEWTQALSSLRHAGMGAQQALGALTNQVVNQAYTVAALDIFWLFGLLSVLMAPLIWFTHRSLAGGGPVAAD
ncbi:MAG TPA: DHA2 family efflux MFS transporter permease subunit [Caulobacteraceae bacterium]|nr:DHA2 family efflux MFS transporter permease subunit [Caulobacteraceae bacterium]